jgi:DNA-binding transcriptional LysR family regulator
MDLNRAATFLRVVESGGFTAAATALGLPTSSVSRSVAKLEEELGVVLLERTTRRVALTEVGRAYFDRVREALSGLDAATAAALDAAREPQGLVRIAVPADIAQVMAPVLATFLRMYPKIRIDLTASSRAVELVGEHVDLAVTVGRLPDSSLISRRLGATVHALYAAPSYLAARGTPTTLAELAHHDAVLINCAGARWELTGPDGVESIQLSGVIAADHLGFGVDATIAGLGVSLLPAYLVAPQLAAGSLVPVLPAYRSESSMQLLAHGARQLPHRVTLLRDFLAEQMSGKCAQHGG